MVEYRLAKARVAGSNPVSCFFYFLKEVPKIKDLGTFSFAEIRLWGRKGANYGVKILCVLLHRKN